MTDSFQQRLEKVIPGGAHTYSRGADQFPQNAPQILSRGNGCYVWGPSDEKYLDYGMALRSVTLGYAHPTVNSAAIKQIELGNNLTRASFVELEAAERLVELLPSVEMVKFAKNGSNVTTAAVKLARSFTSRSKVAIPVEQPFFSFDDWFIGSTVMNRGTLEAERNVTVKFHYGDIESLRNVFESNSGEIAAVMLEAATVLTPCTETCDVKLSSKPCSDICRESNHNFLKQVQHLCREHGALFILDEMITGFRWNLKGAAHYFGVEPDLLTYGKAMANGFSVAALGGRRDVMQLGAINIPNQERTFLLSSTHGAEMSSLGALIGSLDVYESVDVTGHLWSYGQALREGLEERIRAQDLQQHVGVVGPDIGLAMEFRDAEGNISAGLRTLFLQEMVSSDVLMPWIAVSLAHDEPELKKTFEAFERTLVVLKKAVSGDISELDYGAAVKPVFRKFN